MQLAIIFIGNFLVLSGYYDGVHSMKGRGHQPHSVEGSILHHQFISSSSGISDGQDLCASDTSLLKCIVANCAILICSITDIN